MQLKGEVEYLKSLGKFYSNTGRFSLGSFQISLDKIQSYTLFRKRSNIIIPTCINNKHSDMIMVKMYINDNDFIGSSTQVTWQGHSANIRVYVISMGRGNWSEFNFDELSL